jgi:ABC-type sugar transport system ATPase subunit
MKTFIDRIFKKRKQDAEQIEENKEILSNQIETSIKERIDQNKINMEEVEKETQKEVYKKPGHYFADCNCAKCVRWRNQNA